MASLPVTTIPQDAFTDKIRLLVVDDEPVNQQVLKNHLAFGFSSCKRQKKSLKIYECFDGDLPEMRALKSATLTAFETGIAHCFNRAFEQAILVFESVLAQNPSDKTAQLFLKKAKGLMEMGTEANCTGIELVGSN